MDYSFLFPPSSISRIYNTCNFNENISNGFNYDITENETDKVPTEEIYTRFIETNNDIVRNPKIYPQFKGFSLKGFRDYIKKHQEFQYQYDTKVTNINGKAHRNIIKCLKLKDFHITNNLNNQLLNSDSDSD